ncbi:MAG: hypothetical protein KAJ17_05550, partial [Candidatus Krumholzibacteria bacterium]|nr:hypothetical protein [Candidatus Krumholzibacteria bacterium]
MVNITIRFAKIFIYPAIVILLAGLAVDLAAQSFENPITRGRKAAQQALLDPVSHPKFVNPLP